MAMACPRYNTSLNTYGVTASAAFSSRSYSPHSGVLTSLVLYSCGQLSDSMLRRQPTAAWYSSWLAGTACTRLRIWAQFFSSMGSILCRNWSVRSCPATASSAQVLIVSHSPSAASVRSSALLYALSINARIPDSIGVAVIMLSISWESDSSITANLGKRSCRGPRPLGVPLSPGADSALPASYIIVGHYCRWHDNNSSTRKQRGYS